VNVARKEIIPVVALQTHLGSTGLEQVRSFGSVRLVTPVAIPVGYGSMHGRFFQEFLDLGMARHAQFTLWGSEKTCLVSRVWIVTVGACPIGNRRVRAFQSDLLFDIFVTGRAEFVVLGLQKDLAR